MESREKPTQGHTTSKWQNQDLNSGGLDPGSIFNQQCYLLWLRHWMCHFSRQRSRNPECLSAWDWLKVRQLVTHHSGNSLENTQILPKEQSRATHLHPHLKVHCNNTPSPISPLPPSPPPIDSISYHVWATFALQRLQYRQRTKQKKSICNSYQRYICLLFLWSHFISEVSKLPPSDN